MTTTGAPTDIVQERPNGHLPKGTTATTEWPELGQHRGRCRQMHTVTEPGSLYDVLFQNSGASLFVLPLLWTDEHARLLGVRFVARPPMTPVPTANSNPNDKDQRNARPSTHIGKTLSRDLTALLCAHDTRSWCKSHAIQHVLSTLYPEVFRHARNVADLDLHFGGRVFRGAVRVPVVWKMRGMRGVRDSKTTSEEAGARAPHHEGVSQDGPVVAYVNLSHLALLRRSLFRIVPGPEDGDARNTPVRRLQTLRSRRLVPSDAERDAYVVAAFVAMAQAHVYEPSPPSRASGANRMWSYFAPRPSSRRRPSVEVAAVQDRLLRVVAHDEETQDLIVYRAVVTASFLRRFAEPAKAASIGATDGLTIEHQRVSAWPVLGLKERLATALGHDLVEVEDNADDDAATITDVEDDKTTDADTQTEAEDGADAYGGTRLDLQRKRRAPPTLEAMLAEAAEPGTVTSTGTSPPTKRRRTQSLSLAVF